MCDVYVILKWFMNWLIICLMVVLFIILLWKKRLVCLVINIFIFWWIGFGNRFELMFGKFFFFNFDLCRNLGIIVLVVLKRFEFRLML